MKQKERQLWILYSFVVVSTLKTNIVKLLEEKPLTPTQIQREMKLNLSHISRLLKGLKEKDIVECLNPEQRKGKLYSLTKKGSWICDHLK